MSLIIRGATIIDSVADGPLENHSVWIEGNSIKAILPDGDVRLPTGARCVDAAGQFIIPGLMDANVHLLCDIRLENLARHIDRFESLIEEAAQVSLKSGVTTVFDTWGPRRFLTAVRDRINAGDVVGSRIFCAGNIIGFDGPYSRDFIAKTPDVGSAAFINRINAIWAENVGRHLMWLSPEGVDAEVAKYLKRGIDFIKYASNEHSWASGGAFLAFSPDVQASIVSVARRAGVTVQAHTMSIEGLKIAIESGCDIIQHCNMTGPVTIPAATLQLMKERQVGAVVFPFTDRAFTWLMENVSDEQRTMWRASDDNLRNLIACGARILMATDGALFAPEVSTDPALGKSSGRIPYEGENLFQLGSGHFAWFKAMEDKGYPAIDSLRAATINVARAYGKADRLGSLDPGKAADLVILDRNPLEAADNFRSIHSVIKDGVFVDRASLPIKPILTAPLAPPAEEEAYYVPALTKSGSFPMCACMRH